MWWLSLEHKISYLVKLTDKMGIIKVKRTQVLSNGCLNFYHEGFVKQNQSTFHEKDQKNFYLYQKQTDQNKLK